jgi:hypothetical protein
MNYFLLLLLIFPWQIIGQGAPKNVVVTENTKDKLKKLAIQENTTCGEVYYRLKQENQLNQIFSLKDQDK